MKNIITKLINKLLAVFGLELRRRAAIPHVPYDPQMPVEANEYERNMINECGKFSMTGSVRMWALVQSMKHISNNKINGAFVECGVWKGGMTCGSARFALDNSANRVFYAFDSYEGFPEPGEKDIVAYTG